MKATRDGFGDALLEYGDDPRLFVLTADLGGPTRLLEFARRWPEKFLDVGIAEANMIGVAAGMALEGRRVFATSFASFLTGRYDQIRCSVAYQLAPVVLVGTHAGMAIGRDGVTQMGLEDVALMSALPGMTVIEPATYTEAYAITRDLVHGTPEGPVYLRLHRQPVDDHPDLNAARTCTEVAPVVEAPAVLLLTSGGCLGVAVQARAVLGVERTALISVARLKPLPVAIVSAASQARVVCTIEDHVVTGGLGSLVAAELATVGRPTRVVRIGLRDTFPESGRPEDLYEKYEITADAVVNAVRALL